MAGGVTLLAALATIGAIWWAKVLLVPLVLGGLCGYALDPIQRRLVAWHVPRVLGAALILMSLLALGYASAVLLRRQAVGFIDQLPVLTTRVREMVQEKWTGSGAISQVQQAATDLKQAADASAPPPARGVTRVQVEEPSPRLTEWLLRGSVGIAELASQATVILFLIYYLLASGDLYKRKIVRMAGPSLSQKRVTVEILNEITLQIERFIRARLIISGIVTVATWLAFWSLGVSDPAVWGIGAGILNTIPYLGPSVFAAVAATAGLLQFGSATMALAVGGVSVVIASLEGMIVTPWLMGRTSQMNPGAVFVCLSFWGWIWGIWGFLLAVPIMMAVKAICDHVEGWGVVSELLSE